MYHTIVVPLDGLVFSERALPMAMTLARALRTQVILVRGPVPRSSREQIRPTPKSMPSGSLRLIWRRWHPGCPGKA